MYDGRMEGGGGMADKLTPKQRTFVNEYLTDLNATRAVLRAGYKMTEGAAAVQGSQLLRNPKIQEAIQEAREAREKASRITSAWVLQQVAKIAEDEETQPRDRLKALELLGKYCGTWDKPQDQDAKGVKVVFESEMEGWSQ